MSTNQYAAITLRATALIARKGAPVTFGAPGSAPTYNPLTDSATDSGAGRITGMAVADTNDPQLFMALSLTIAGAVTLLVGAAGLRAAPTLGQSMTWAGASYYIRHVEAIAPAGQAIAYLVIGGR